MPGVAVRMTDAHGGRFETFMGKTVQFRLDLVRATEAAEGWYIDDVNFQTCVQDDTPVNSFDIYLPYIDRELTVSFELVLSPCSNVRAFFFPRATAE